MKKLIILGSSRNDGNTIKLVEELVQKSGWDMVNLNDHQFGYYDYILTAADISKNTYEPLVLRENVISFLRSIVYLRENLYSNIQ